ncbi:MAG: hypothetical protein KDA21_13165, partial [Phycisphaerales bacterium]|nr:hypothetical protein [Phycisphaerales bacterium]
MADQKTTRLMLAALAGAAALAALAGCSGHGQYTGTFKQDAELRLTNLKAATEWDRARGQFLAGDLAKALETVD